MLEKRKGKKGERLTKGYEKTGKWDKEQIHKILFDGDRTEEARDIKRLTGTFKTAISKQYVRFN